MKEDNYDFVETDLPNVGPGGMVVPLPNVIDENEILDDEHDALLSTVRKHLSRATRLQRCHLSLCLAGSHAD